MKISEKLKMQNEADFSIYPSFEGKILNIEISSLCNESCIYCPYSARKLHKNGKLIEEELFYRVTKEAKELGITDIGLYITGEPFINPNLYKYVKYLKQNLKYEYVYISTNGILCTPNNLEQLVDAGIDSIKFSVSGATKETFVAHHGVDAFEKVLKNLQYAYKYRNKTNQKFGLYMFTIITNYNKKEFYLFKEIFEPYLDELVMTNVVPFPGIKGVKEYLCLSEKVNHIKQPIKLPCSDLFNRIVVNEEGYLCSCCYDTRTGYTAIQDLHEMSLKEAVYGETMTQIRQLHLNKSIKGIICENCITGQYYNVKPLSPSDKIKLVHEKIDISDEIKKRFSI